MWFKKAILKYWIQVRKAKLQAHSTYQQSNQARKTTVQLINLVIY